MNDSSKDERNTGQVVVASSWLDHQHSSEPMDEQGGSRRGVLCTADPRPREPIPGVLDIPWIYKCIYIAGSARGDRPTTSRQNADLDLDLDRAHRLAYSQTHRLADCRDSPTTLLPIGGLRYTCRSSASRVVR